MKSAKSHKSSAVPQRANLSAGQISKDDKGSTSRKSPWKPQSPAARRRELFGINTDSIITYEQVRELTKDHLLLMIRDLEKAIVQEQQAKTEQLATLMPDVELLPIIEPTSTRFSDKRLLKMRRKQLLFFMRDMEREIAYIKKSNQDLANAYQTGYKNGLKASGG
jgi:hypothetical protein